MQETELKSIIGEDIYTRVKRAFNWSSVRVQENYYYTDKNGVLRKNRIMVRIRVIDDVGKIQVKTHKNSGSPLQICEENEYAVDGVPETLSAERAKEITGLDVGELYRMGVAVTKRRSLIRNGSELCLDKTMYFDKVDYEVELEYEDKVSADLLLKLTAIGVAFNKKSIGKFSRFLDEYNRLNETKTDRGILLDEVKKIVRRAGDIMTSGHDYEIHTKGSAANYVSDIDIRVEKFLREKLKPLRQDAVFIGEESDSNNYHAKAMWIADPIDGTANFVRDMDLSAVSVALVENGESVLAVVYNPYSGRMFYAEKGGGAYMNGQKLSVSQRPLENSILSIAMSVYKKEYAPMCFDVAEKMLMKCEDIRRLGSAAIELCNLAAGKIEMFFEARLFPWDYAAASLLIREAGGFITSLDSGIVYDRPIPIIAASSQDKLSLLRDEARAAFDGITIE